MDKKMVCELVTNKLKQYNYEIHNQDIVNENEKFFVVDDAIISTDEVKRNMCVSFHASAKIEDAVILALNLTEIRGVKLFVGDTFVFDDDGKYIDGKEALEFYEKKRTQDTIDFFMLDQSQKHFLAHAEGYKC